MSVATTITGKRKRIKFDTVKSPWVAEFVKIAPETVRNWANTDKMPPPIHSPGQKKWLRSDIVAWSEWGFCDRETFIRRKAEMQAAQ